MPLDHILRIAPHIHIGEWTIAEPLEELLQSYTFTAEEIEQGVPKMHPERLKGYLGVRILAGTMVQGAVFFKDEFGKPHLSVADEYGHKPYISWSHSGQHAAVITNSNAPTGIDVEKIDTRILRIRNKFCNATDMLSCTTEEHLLHHVLLIIWGAKESMYKYYGKKEVDFREHMTVKPFELSTSGTIDGVMHLPAFQKVFKIGYRVYSNRILVWVEN